MTDDAPQPVLYGDLADWWPVLSDPATYAAEAAFYLRVLREVADGPIETLLELGSGGGNNASHLKRHARLTLVDVAPGMVEVSRRLNPECEHAVGDMRTVRLDRTFDAVFVHDAVGYMTSEEDLRRAIGTAAIHCRPGGAVLFSPDYVRETFRESTDHGGYDRGDRSLRYLEWNFDEDPDDATFESEMVYLLREGDGPVRCVRDRHVMGLFDLATWERLLREAGFAPEVVPYDRSVRSPTPVLAGRLGARPAVMP